MTKHLIVNADDLGISVPVNLAVDQGFRDGIITSASLLVNMPACRHAVEEVVRPNPGLGVGVHLNATCGPPILGAEKVPLLIDGPSVHNPASQEAHGNPPACFGRGFVGLWRLVHSKHRDETLAQLRREWTAQVERAEHWGVAVDHLDAHRHVHMIPALFDLAAELAQDRGIAVRVSGEAFRFARRGLISVLACLASGGLLKNVLLSHLARFNRQRWPGLPSADHYFGTIDTGRMTLPRLRSIVRSLPDGVTEIVVHPSLAASASEAAEPAAGEYSRDCPDFRAVTRSVRTKMGLSPSHDTGSPSAASRQDQRFLRRRQASRELAALVDPSLCRTVACKGITLASFKALSRYTLKRIKSTSSSWTT